MEAISGVEVALDPVEAFAGVSVLPPDFARTMPPINAPMTAMAMTIIIPPPLRGRSLASRAAAALVHRALRAPCAPRAGRPRSDQIPSAAQARCRSAIRSAGASRPIEKRTRCPERPAACPRSSARS